MTTFYSRVRRDTVAYVTQVQQCPKEVDGVRIANAYDLWSIPIPIHRASVTQAHKDAMWVVTFHTMPGAKPIRFHMYPEAVRTARDIIGRKAGADLQTFSPAQRIMMGTQRACPKRLGAVLCGQPHSVGSVWCEWHPGGGDKDA